MNDLRDRLKRLEDLVGTPDVDDADGTDGGPSLVSKWVQHGEQISTLSSAHAELVRDVGSRFVSATEELLSFVNSVKERFMKMEDEVALIKRALNSSSTGDAAASKVKVPEPKSFNGSRNAKELENFLWDVEQYFKAAKVPEREWVTLTSMYLSGDAKLWWRTRMAEDASAGRPNIDSWEMLRKELKAQFLPCNAGWIARQALKNLKHDGTVREYVTEFASLMLDIHGMYEEDKLFNFISGLQPWAQTELRRHGVTDLPTAMAAAERLVDFVNPSGTSKGKGFESNKDGKPHEGKTGKSHEGKPGAEASRIMGGGTAGNGKGKGCYLCNGPHLARDCPKREKVTALLLLEGDKEKEVDGNEENGVARTSALQLMGN